MEPLLDISGIPAFCENNPTALGLTEFRLLQFI
jgi:hypothetical protein